MPTWRVATGSDNPATACIAAEFRSGNNALTGPWEYAVNCLSGAVTAQQLAWGSSNGQLQSGPVNVDLECSPGGGANSVSWTVGGGKTILVGPQTYGNITQVGFYVAVDQGQNSETTEWETLDITFYDANNNESDLNVTTNLPYANFPTGPASSFWIAVPDSDFTAVRLSVVGQIHLNASVVTPGTNALMGYIYVWTSTCATTT